MRFCWVTIKSDLSAVNQKVRKHFPSANKEEITMPEALENQHRCGYTYPPPQRHSVWRNSSHVLLESLDVRKCELEWAVWAWRLFCFSLGMQNRFKQTVSIQCGTTDYCFFKYIQWLIWIQFSTLPSCQCGFPSVNWAYSAIVLPLHFQTVVVFWLRALHISLGMWLQADLPKRPLVWLWLTFDGW